MKPTLHRSLLLFTLLLGLCLTLTAAPGAPAMASPKEKKSAIDMKDWQALIKDMYSKRWAVRCFGALQALNYKDLKVQALLVDRYAAEKEDVAKSFYLHALGQAERDDLRILVDGPFIEARVDELMATDNQLKSDCIVEFLNGVFGTKFPNHPPSWAKAWGGQKANLTRACEKERDKFEKKEKMTLQEFLAKNLIAPKEDDGGSFVPDKLQEFLGRIENEGIDLAILLDDTGSMESSITAAKQGIASLMNAMALLSPKFQVGLVSYKDSVNKVVELTDNIKDMQAVVDKLFADGGDDFPEAISLALWYARDNFKWRPKAVKMFVVIADAPYHKNREVELHESVVQLAKDGYSLHMISVTDTVVDGFDKLAELGNGASITLGKDQTKLMVTMLNLIFGNEYKDFTQEFAEMLFRSFKKREDK